MDGGQIPDHSDSDGCHRVMCTLQPDPGGDYVSALVDRPVFARFLMVIVALLQSVLFGRSHQKFAPGSWCRRMSVTSVVWVVGIVTLVSALSVRLVFARSTILMFIVALLQSVWLGRSRQKFAPGSWCRRMSVSSVVWVVGSVTLVSALSVRLVFARSTILMFFVALLQSVRDDVPGARECIGDGRFRR